MGYYRVSITLVNSLYRFLFDDSGGYPEIVNDLRGREWVEVDGFMAHVYGTPAHVYEKHPETIFIHTTQISSVCVEHGDEKLISYKEYENE